MIHKKNFIKVTAEVRSALLKEFHVSERTIYNAINFITSGYTAECIRNRALELGGKMMVEAAEMNPQK